MTCMLCIIRCIAGGAAQTVLCRNTGCGRRQPGNCRKGHRMRKYIIGMDLGGTNIKTSLFTKDFSVVAEQRTPTMVSLGSEGVLQRMADNIRELLLKAGAAAEEMEVMGMGVPGLLDIEKGISLFSPNFPQWENVPIAGWFKERLGIPVFIDNDVRVNLYGECYFGAGKGKKNVVLLTLGTGLGAGVMIDGHILYGATGSMGEIGHMNMYREGRPCRCKSSGCLGRYVSALGLLRTVKEKIEAKEKTVLTDWVKDPEEITAEMVSRAFDEGDQLAREAMEETGEILGFGLVNVINLYNPECVIIGGGMSAAGERLLSKAREVVDTHALEISRKACTIVTASLGDASGMLGAAKAASIKTENRMVV